MLDKIRMTEKQAVRVPRYFEGYDEGVLVWVFSIREASCAVVLVPKAYLIVYILARIVLSHSQGYLL